MTNTSTTLTLGRNLADDVPVRIQPTDGPVKIYGGTGSGKTVVARSLFRQLAANTTGHKPVLAIHSYHEGYIDIAREYGGSCVTLGLDTDPADARTGPGPMDNLPAPSILSVDASALFRAWYRHGTAGLSAAQNQLRRILTAYLLYDPGTHLIVDPLDPLLADQRCMDLFDTALRTARSKNTAIACVVSDPLRMISRLDRATQGLLALRGSTLLTGGISRSLWDNDDLLWLIPPLRGGMWSQSPAGEAVLSTPTGRITRLSISPDRHLTGRYPADASPTADTRRPAYGA